MEKKHTPKKKTLSYVTLLVIATKKGIVVEKKFSKHFKSHILFLPSLKETIKAELDEQKALQRKSLLQKTLDHYGYKVIGNDVTNIETGRLFKLGDQIFCPYYITDPHFKIPNNNSKNTECIVLEKIRGVKEIFFQGDTCLIMKSIRKVINHSMHTNNSNTETSKMATA